MDKNDTGIYLSMEQVREIDNLSRDIVKDLLLKKDYKNKKELMAEAQKAVDASNKDKKMKIELKLAYAKAYSRLDNLSWIEYKVIKDKILENQKEECDKGL